MFEERLATIKRKLGWLNLCWPNETLCPRATLDQVQALRELYGIDLPTDYQAFIESIADGVYGYDDIQCPYLESLFCENSAMSVHPEYAHRNRDRKTLVCYGFIPFPIQWRLDDWGHSEHGIDKPVFKPLRWEELSFYERAKSDLAFIVNWNLDWTIRVLVLTGEEKGFMWHFNIYTGIAKPFRNEETGEHLSFLDWFEARLDYSLYRSGSPSEL